MTPRVQTPALGFNFSNRCHLAESGYVGILPVRKFLLEQGFTAKNCLNFLSAIQPHYLCKKFQLFRRKISVRAINLPIDMAGVDKKHLVLSWCLFLSAVQKPQRARKGNCVEEIRPDGDHDVDR